MLALNLLTFGNPFDTATEQVVKLGSIVVLLGGFGVWGRYFIYGIILLHSAYINDTISMASYCGTYCLQVPIVLGELF